MMELNSSMIMRSFSCQISTSDFFAASFSLQLVISATTSAFWALQLSSLRDKVWSLASKSSSRLSSRDKRTCRSSAAARSAAKCARSFRSSYTAESKAWIASRLRSRITDFSCTRSFRWVVHMSFSKAVVLFSETLVRDTRSNSRLGIGTLVACESPGPDSLLLASWFAPMLLAPSSSLAPRAGDAAITSASAPFPRMNSSSS
mmetsp:Transcript_17506/g.50087  ORF Transcript_17506/g.50087 Transcript_17506/m.50087 type:complete len:203 (-) Transcript_17506:591-1199(-)